MAKPKYAVARATVNLQNAVANQFYSVDVNDEATSMLLDRGYLVLVDPASMPEGSRPPGADAALAAAEAGTPSPDVLPASTDSPAVRDAQAASTDTSSGTSSGTSSPDR